MTKAAPDVGSIHKAGLSGGPEILVSTYLFPNRPQNIWDPTLK